jgi:hypothetical protein
MVSLWPGWIVQLVCTSLAWRTVVLSPLQKKGPHGSHNMILSTAGQGGLLGPRHAAWRCLLDRPGRVGGGCRPYRDRPDGRTTGICIA